MTAPPVARRPARHQRLQTAFAVVAIGAAVALPVILLSVGGGVSAHELAQLRTSGYAITVSGAGLHGVGRAHGLAQSIDRLPDVAAASPVLSVPVVAFLGGSGPTPVLGEGVIPAAFEATEGPTERSLFPSPLPLGDPTDLAHYANGTYLGPSAARVLVSSPLANAYGVSVGSTLTLARTDDRSTGAPFTVSGTFGVPAAALGPTAAFAVLLPLTDLQLLSGTARLNGTSGPLLDQADTIQVSVVGAAATDPARVAAVGRAISQLAPYYGINSLTDQARQLESLAGVLTGFYLALSSVSLAIGVTFLTLVQLRRIESGRRWIGIRRAIGVPPRQIAGGVVREGFLLAAGGAALGVGSGVVAVELLASFGSGAVQTAARLAIFDPVTLALVVLGVFGLSTLSAAIATRAALRLSIPEVLR